MMSQPRFKKTTLSAACAPVALPLRGNERNSFSATRHRVRHLHSAF